MDQVSLMEQTMIPVSAIDVNRGQIEGVPANPRLIIAEQFDMLVRSIRENPEMLELRELTVYDNGNGEYVVLGGNMRLQAMRLLDIKDAPCKVLTHDTSKETLMDIILRDNMIVGEYDQEALAEWDAAELEDWGVLLHQDNDVTEEEDEDGRVTLTFTFSAEQFKHVKHALNEVDGKDNGWALLKILGYERA